MDTSVWMIAISGAVLVSYWYLHLGRVLRFPAVVFLLLTGLLLRAGTDLFELSLPLPRGLLPLLGTIGLILIVLEGALDLELVPGRRRFLQSTFAAALAGVLLTTAALALPLVLLLDVAWPTAVLLGVPFAVISSAVAIPSAEVLSRQDREFVIYESSWSDILGVMLFNAALVAVAGGGGGFTLNLLGGGLAVLVIGSLLGVAMWWLVGHLEGHVKFLPLIFALILVYAAAKALNLSPLLIVLVLGLILNNPHLLMRLRVLRRFRSNHYAAELDKLKHLTTEATFLVRTFFFLLLGYGTDLRELADLRAWGFAIAIVALVFALRWPIVALLGGGRARPLVWVGPRGLITVLLFFSLPPGVVPEAFPPAALILVVIVSCVAMAVGLLIDGQPRAAEPDTAAEPGSGALPASPARAAQPPG